MICWPDVWEHLKRQLPLIEVWASLGVYIALLFVLIWAPKLRKPWAKITSRALGALGIVPLPIFLFVFMLSAGNPPAQSRTAKSLNGAEATLNYEAGFLGRDFTEVTLKRSDCCRHSQVFWHAGPGYFDDVKMHWLDPNHLNITYHSRPSDSNHCVTISETVVITCAQLPWPQSPTSNPAKEQPGVVREETN